MTHDRPRFPVLALLILIFALIAFPAIAADEAEEDDSLLNSGALAGLAMRNIGPAFMSGRVSDIAAHPTDPGTWYVAVGSGGVWKTGNSGTTWQPIFENEGSYSVGCLTIDPHDPATIWVGSGENVSGRHVGYGDGVYRSRDGGATWENLGLKESEHIGRIVVHPEDPNTVYVAAQGPLWSAGGERGVFMTTDGGATWEKVLGGGEYTGANEVVMHPANPDILFAVLHQRFRDVAALMNGGPESGIHKSTDGGRTWRQVKAGLPEGDLGKIGIAISPQRPERDVRGDRGRRQRKGGFWRSRRRRRELGAAQRQDRAGHRPALLPGDLRQPARLRPRVLHGRAHGGHARRRHDLRGSRRKGQARRQPRPGLQPEDDPDYLLAGCDGGLYESWDLGQNWKFVANLPVTQFYKVAVDYDEPFYNIMGGTQDNNTQYGPHAHRQPARHPQRRLARDPVRRRAPAGHGPHRIPTSSIRAWQQCNFYRERPPPTGEVVSIKPQPAADEPHDRWNWDGPILISRFDPARLYVASQRLWRSDDRGDSLDGPLGRPDPRRRPPAAADHGPGAEHRRGLGPGTRCRSTARSPTSPNRRSTRTCSTSARTTGCCT